MHGFRVAFFNEKSTQSIFYICFLGVSGLVAVCKFYAYLSDEEGVCGLLLTRLFLLPFSLNLALSLPYECRNDYLENFQAPYALLFLLVDAGIKGK